MKTWQRGEKRECRAYETHRWATCLCFTFFFSSLPLIIYSTPFSPVLPYFSRIPFFFPASVLFIFFFFISVPLTVPWHSKALLPSLTLFHGAADDNYWFENWGQWETRIIPAHTHHHHLTPTPRGCGCSASSSSLPVPVSSAERRIWLLVGGSDVYRVFTLDFRR